MINGVVTRDSHLEIHHWVNDIADISPIDSSFYANINIYLLNGLNGVVNTQKYYLINTIIQIEGPLPICEKIFKKTKSFPFVKQSQLDKYLPLVNYKFHGVRIEKDPVLEPIHSIYDAQYEEYRLKIATIIGTEDILKVETNGDFYIGNIITDIEKKWAEADICVIGYGSLRSFWNPGRLTKADIFDMLPFDNKLCSFTMNGDEIRKMMEILQTGKKAYYPTSGLKQILNKNKKGEIYLADIKLFDGYVESELLPNKEYVVTAVDYNIVQGGDDFYKVLQWYVPRNLNCDFGSPYEIIEAYLSLQKIIDVRQYKNENNPRIKKLF